VTVSLPSCPVVPGMQQEASRNVHPLPPSPPTVHPLVKSGACDIKKRHQSDCNTSVQCRYGSGIEQSTESVFKRDVAESQSSMCRPVHCTPSESESFIIVQYTNCTTRNELILAQTLTPTQWLGSYK